MNVRIVFVGSHTTGATICLILKDFTCAKCNTYPSNYPNVQYRYIMIAVLHVCTGNSLWIPTHPPSPPFSKKDSRLRYRATGGASTRSVMTLGASFQTWPMELDSRSLANDNRNRNKWKWTSFKMRTLYSKGCVWNATLHYLSLPEASPEALRNVWPKSINVRNLHLHSLILPNWVRVSFEWLLHLVLWRLLPKTLKNIFRPEFCRFFYNQNPAPVDRHDVCIPIV